MTEEGRKGCDGRDERPSGDAPPLYSNVAGRNEERARPGATPFLHVMVCEKDEKEGKTPTEKRIRRV